MSRNHTGGAEQSRLTLTVLEHYGNRCWLRLPGCTRVATTKDHIIPKSAGGTDALENLRPACQSCNSRRQDRTISGIGATIHVVIGPPAAGKSRHVAEHAAPNDVVIDLDRIALALLPPGYAGPDHDYPPHVRHVAIGARAAAIRRASRLREHVGVWIIHAVPDERTLREYAALHYDITVIDPGRAIVEARNRSQRPTLQQRTVARWYKTYPSPQRVAQLTATAADSATATEHRPPVTAAGQLEPSRRW